MVTANIEVYKLDQVTIDTIALPLYRKLASEVMDIDDNLVKKFAENEDLAISWLMSLASSKGVDMIRIVIPINNSVIEYAYTVPKKGAVSIMVFPRITRVHRILLLDAIQNPESLREIVIDTHSSSECLRVTDLPPEYYVYEIPLFKETIKALSNKTIVFQTDDGIAIVDCSKLYTITSSRDRAEVTKEKSRRRRKKQKSRKTRRATSSK
ncbi:MAG TPA: hypothetical protein EYP48_01820 [Ignisphaera sp.]|uniref:Uncharacterized protein n=1 Tax=Ignisphaera aggregans TaxID=334771 RepID=A0A832YT13_9CREN|nr:hypothetical protein [Ignisphaera sp.]HIP57225.1 hypothetical protein [Ignisphaera aggregans]